MVYRPFPFEAFRRIVGGNNWAIARRTRNIVNRYGEDVICLSPADYRKAVNAARMEVYGTTREVEE